MHTDKMIAEIRDALSVSHMMIVNIRRRFPSERLQMQHDKTRPGHPKEVDDKLEAVIITTACSQPPDGTDHWTMRMNAHKNIEREMPQNDR